MITTSCACDSRRPAAVMRTNCDFVRRSSMLRRAGQAHARAQSADELRDHRESDPLYGTFPSIPSGTSFETSASSWK